MATLTIIPNQRIVTKPTTFYYEMKTRTDTHNQKLKQVNTFDKRRENFIPFQQNQKPFCIHLATIFSITHFCFSPFLRNKRHLAPHCLSILSQACIFYPFQLPAFSTKTPINQPLFAMQNTCFLSKRKRIIPNFMRIFMLLALYLAA